jgi:hypothetical protein
MISNRDYRGLRQALEILEEIERKDGLPITFGLRQARNAVAEVIRRIDRLADPAVQERLMARAKEHGVPIPPDSEAD